MDKGLKQELFEQIKEKNDIVSVISEYVSLRRAGRSMVGLCPFHSEKTPSFNVNPEKQFFYCFGCGTGGDVFSFIMKLENLDFIGAAKILADRSGIVWPELPKSGPADHYREQLWKINSLTAALYNQYLLKAEAGKQARQYLTERGINADSWKRFNLGYAPATWHSLTGVLRKKGFALEQAEKLGLVSLGENGFYDRFRERIIFPITDIKGNVVGFGGRVIDNSQPKYLNSPETELFHKGRFLFGLSIAKEAIRRLNQAIIVEGYFDVIQAHQAGFTQTVASLGTALTKEQARLIKKYTSEVVLAYDADTAGQKATLRGMELLQEAGLKVKILNLPVNEDPDSFIKGKGGAEFASLLAKAADLIDFKIGLAIKEFNLDSPDGKSRAVQAVLPELAAINNRITREFYLRQLSRMIGISEVSIFAEFEEWLKRNRKKSPVLDRNRYNSYTNGTNEKIGPFIGGINPETLSPLKKGIFETEKELLQMALQEYDKFKRIKEELNMEEFSFEIWRDLWAEIQRAGGIVENSRFLMEISDSLREVAVSLVAEHEMKQSQSDIEGSIQRLKMLHLQERIQNLTDQLTTGRDELGQPISEAGLKLKIQEFTELKRKLQKEYPRFSAGI
ncbi:MAG: DNA primase [Bacillota bacterium]